MPQTVLIRDGWVGSFSTFSRKRRTCTVTVDWSPNVQPHTSLIRCSRVNAMPGCASRKVSRSSSRTVSASSTPVAGGSPGRRVDDDRARAQDLRIAGWLRGDRRSTDSTRRTSSRGRERLRHVVVRADLETGDPVLGLAERGQHDHRQVRVGAPDPPADLQTVDPGSMRSSTTRSGRCSAIASSAERPSPRAETSCPARSR